MLTLVAACLAGCVVAFSLASFVWQVVAHDRSEQLTSLQRTSAVASRMVLVRPQAHTPTMSRQWSLGASGLLGFRALRHPFVHPAA